MQPMAKTDSDKTRTVLPAAKPGSLDDLGTRLVLPQAAGRLVVVGGPRDGTVFSVTHSTSLIGRDRKNNIVLGWDDSVHRDEHAALEWRDNRFTLRDLQGRNPVLVNGRQITHPTELRLGDEITIGTTILRLSAP